MTPAVRTGLETTRIMNTEDGFQTDANHQTNNPERTSKDQVHDEILPRPNQGLIAADGVGTSPNTGFKYTVPYLCPQLNCEVHNNLSSVSMVGSGEHSSHPSRGNGVLSSEENSHQSCLQTSSPHLEGVVREAKTDLHANLVTNNYQLLMPEPRPPLHQSLSTYQAPMVDPAVVASTPADITNNLRPCLLAGLGPMLSENLCERLALLADRRSDPKSWRMVVRKAADHPFCTGLEWGFTVKRLGVRVVPCRCFAKIPALLRGPIDWGCNCVVLMACAVVILCLLRVVLWSGILSGVKRLYRSIKGDLMESVLRQVEPW